jgi:hypothetical protein
VLLRRHRDEEQLAALPFYTGYRKPPPVNLRVRALAEFLKDALPRRVPVHSSDSREVTDKRCNIGSRVLLDDKVQATVVLPGGPARLRYIGESSLFVTDVERHGPRVGGDIILRDARRCIFISGEADSNAVLREHLRGYSARTAACFDAQMETPFRATSQHRMNNFRDLSTVLKGCDFNAPVDRVKCALATLSGPIYRKLAPPET